MTRLRYPRLFRHYSMHMLALLVLLLPRAAGAESTVDLDTNGPITGDQISYFTGDPVNLEPEAIARQARAAAWQPLPGAIVSFGLDWRPYWFRIELANSTREHQLRYLQFDARLLDHLDIYVVANGRLLRSWQQGDAVPFSRRPVLTRALTVPITLAPQQRISVLLRARTNNVLQLPLALYSGAALAGITQLRSLLFGLYYGMMAVILCYNLMAFATIRDRSYLYNVAYVAALALFYASLNGLASQFLWPAVGGIVKPATLISLSIATLFASLFTRQFLKLREHAARFDRAFVIMAWIAAAAALLVTLAPSRESIQLLVVLLAMQSTAIVVAGAARWRAGDTAGMLFTVAWAALLVSWLVMGAEKFGLILLTPVIDNIGQIGSAINVVLLALAMVSRFSDERRQRFHAEIEALEYERANETLRRLSTTDPLTGVHNRRFFDEHFQYRFSRDRRAHEPIALLVIDIDFFKRVNDTHGHAAGDQMLSEIAMEIAAEARHDTDVIARYGGEEFVAMLPATTSAQAIEMAERIRARVANRSYRIVGEGGADHTLRASVSIGVAAAIPRLLEHTNDLLKRADSALYRAKNCGRNRVMAYQEPLQLSQLHSS